MVTPDKAVNFPKVWLGRLERKFLLIEVESEDKKH